MSQIKWLVLFLCQASLSVSVVSSQSCFGDQKLSNIPANHLSQNKTKPWVFGHKGNPKEYQENTIEGFQSLVGLKADGLDADAFLTNDGQLVLFRDENAMALTGNNKNIWEMTKAEIQNLTYKRTITYGKQRFTYNSSLEVALLEDLLKAMQNNSLLIYIEMKPMSIIHKDIAYTKRSLDTGKAVAQLITKHGLENRVFLASSDPVKTWAAKQENPNIVIGTSFLSSYWKQNSAWYSDLKCQLKSLPGLKTCFDSLPNDKTMMDVLFKNASISKSINDSFLDIDFEVFREGNIDRLALNMLEKNYKDKASLGSFTIYDMKLNETQLQATEPMVQSLINDKFERLFTDNVTRLREKLGKHIKPTSNAPTGPATTPGPNPNPNTNPNPNPNTNTNTNPSPNPNTNPNPNPNTNPNPNPKPNNAASKRVWPILALIPLLVTLLFG